MSRTTLSTLIKMRPCTSHSKMRRCAGQSSYLDWAWFGRSVYLFLNTICILTSSTYDITFKFQPIKMKYRPSHLDDMKVCLT